MIPEEHWNNVEWFDSDVWKPPVGKIVLVLSVDGRRERAVYDGDNFISINDREPILSVGYWSYDE